ncbi:MAG TPA: DUF6587 family protein [Steroidobacteraceae bacterium]|jgi:hypothetical protein|nr:DUF6587 family protein [Steroidobacteraceae bacterium]
MNTLLDNSLVGLALLVSLGYAVSSLGPRAWRNQLLASLSRLLARAPAYLALGRVARRLSAASIATSRGAAAGSCGGCDNCGAEQAGAPQSAAAEVNVPVATIGRRATETPAAVSRR